ncbi:DUF4224 domain-containing protein [Serratia marcescens]
MQDNKENDIISDTDIERITGYKSASKQCEALELPASSLSLAEMDALALHGDTLITQYR